MSKAVALHPDVHNLLITNNIDNFTVSEIRDALMYSSNYFSGKSETRRYIYRVICKLVKLGLLIKHPNKQIKKIKYTKPELFFTANFVIKQDVKVAGVTAPKIQVLNNEATVTSTDFFAELLEQKQEHEAELAIKLGEVEEFKALMKRYPQKNELFNRFYLETRDCSAQLIGKVNALTKVLNTSKLAA
ncbi:hypothetical protein [Moritella viscosa]|uniref:Response regulator n=1 Tax=Moritella viscosa TaxID=80854 RepID=A0A1L0AT67_9GAMM|nr:hypothetical protein [Moritella viscosa]SGZ18683.1 Putative uncharacterized protein [Moritella viscosa]